MPETKESSRSSEPTREPKAGAATSRTPLAILDLVLGCAAVLAAAWTLRTTSSTNSTPIVAWSHQTSVTPDTTVRITADHVVHIGDTSYRSLTAVPSGLPQAATVQLEVEPDVEGRALVQVAQWLRARGTRTIVLTSSQGR